MAEQFDDFMLKVEGELTRRNRLRTETFNKFEEIDGVMRKLIESIENFRHKQQKMTSTITKLAYV